jgi:hypothetical protein
MHEEDRPAWRTTSAGHDNTGKLIAAFRCTHIILWPNGA